ncbi:MAG TPA: c-type cytochrome [Bauldia sp.]|nr:c-type cytochrome [Bauldia sp.]
MAFVALAPSAVLAADVSVERGKQISTIGGCHDCHTVGYNESGGKIDPVTALKGSPVGFQGPWGTTYPMNLRITAANKSEDEFVKFGKTFQTRPPMPWYNVHAMDEGDLRSLYQYIKSLGAPGDPAPDALPPGTEPKTPYIVFAPPVMPKG